MTVSTKVLPPVPPEFGAVFVEKGWRGIERMYGARTDLLVKWREMAGGARLDELRREYLRGDVSAVGRVKE